jgi:hypothetical protein
MSSCLRRALTPWAAFLALPLLAGCSYLDQAWRAADLPAEGSQSYQVEALVQADIELKRLRNARCYSPLLDPATMSAAAADPRLGTPWVDELLRDCPTFSAFIANLTLRRARNSGLPPLLDRRAGRPARSRAASEP